MTFFLSTNSLVYEINSQKIVKNGYFKKKQLYLPYFYRY